MDSEFLNKKNNSEMKRDQSNCIFYAENFTEK